MKIINSLILICSFAVSSWAQFNPNFQPIPSSYNINSNYPVYALNLAYGQVDSLQSFHICLPDTVGNYPLILFIHGGGFVGGSKDDMLNDAVIMQHVKQSLEAGFAFASIDYRLLPSPNDPINLGTETVGVIKCLNDSKRALQFMRYHATDLLLDADRVGVFGNSAGAGTSLWLATRDDMADSNATDPILRMSTRVCAVAANGPQSTYDLYQWETDVFDDFDGLGTDYTVDSLSDLLGFLRFSDFYGGLDSNYHFLYDPSLIQYRQDVDMIGHLSSDDPPMYLSSGSGAVHPSQDPLHHGNHGLYFYNEAVNANISEVKANISAHSINTTAGEERIDFLIRHLNLGCSGPTSLTTIETETAYKLYPNPARHSLFIEGFDETSSYQIYNSLGQLIKTDRRKEVDLSSFAKGLYFIRIGKHSLRFVKE